MVGTMSMTWCHCERISPFALNPFGQLTAVALRVPPQCEATCLVHWSGVSMAQAQPTAVVAASAEHAVAQRVQRALSTGTFRVYSSEDVTGVELAGALKNVIAIAAGIVDGLGYGHNTVAALITRGLAEMSRLAGGLGGRPETLAGLDAAFASAFPDPTNRQLEGAGTYATAVVLANLTATDGELTGSATVTISVP